MSMEISGNNVSLVWLEVLKYLSYGKHECSPLIVQINLDGNINLESGNIRKELDKFLKYYNDRSCLTVSNTIFPRSLWNKANKRSELYYRYYNIWPLIKKDKSNINGTYFLRMINYNKILDDKTTNQLEHIIETWLRGNHRRSALQAAIFDPRMDHNHSKRKEFPCLHQIAFNPLGINGNDGLELIAFYANQTIIEKAYGNYLGLINLGQFMSYEMGIKLTRLTCISCVAKLSSRKRISDIKPLLKTLGI